MRTTLLVLLLTSLTACATVEGVGRDISGGAKRVSNWF
jgi:predicted small secreted protein